MPDSHSSHTHNDASTQPPRKMCYEDFEPLKMLGSGGFGKVFLVRKLSEGQYSGKLFAMKILKKQRVCRLKTDIRHTWAERSILQSLIHPFLVKLHFAFQDERNLYLALEYCPGGELFSYLERCDYLCEEAACFYLCEILLALGYLHSREIIYRDIKPENILLDAEGHCKLTDFNLAVQTNSLTRTFCGTREYIAPEMYSCVPYDKNVDWWCLGILFYDMLAGSPPWGGTKPEIKEQVLHAEVPLLNEFTEEAVDLLLSLLKKNPKERLGAGIEDVEAVKRHAFFVSHKVEWDNVLGRRTHPPFYPRLRGETDTSLFCSQFTCQPVRLSHAEAILEDPFKDFSYAGSEASVGGRLNHVAGGKLPGTHQSGQVSRSSLSSQSSHCDNSFQDGFSMELENGEMSFLSSSSSHNIDPELPSAGGVSLLQSFTATSCPPRRKFLVSEDFVDLKAESHVINTPGSVLCPLSLYGSESEEEEDEDEQDNAESQPEATPSVVIRLDDGTSFSMVEHGSMVCLKEARRPSRRDLTASTSAYSHRVQGISIIRPGRKSQPSWYHRRHVRFSCHQHGNYTTHTEGNSGRNVNRGLPFSLDSDHEESTQQRMYSFSHDALVDLVTSPAVQSATDVPVQHYSTALMRNTSRILQRC